LPGIGWGFAQGQKYLWKPSSPIWSSADAYAAKYSVDIKPSALEGLENPSHSLIAPWFFMLTEQPNVNL
jgi:hypothetical protein